MLVKNVKTKAKHTPNCSKGVTRRKFLDKGKNLKKLGFFSIFSGIFLINTKIQKLQFSNFFSSFTCIKLAKKLQFTFIPLFLDSLPDISHDSDLILFLPHMFPAYIRNQKLYQCHGQPRFFLIGGDKISKNNIFQDRRGDKGGCVRRCA